MFQPFSSWAQNYAPLIDSIDLVPVTMTESSLTIKMDIVTTRELTHSECERVQDLLLPYARPFCHALGAIVATVRGLSDMHLEVDTEWFYYE